MNWEGFLIGMSDFGQERLKEERQKKMQEQLLALKEKYEIAAEERAESRERRKVKGSRDKAGEPGMIEDVNEYGEVIGTRALDEYTRSQREQAAENARLERANIESQIKDRTDRVALGYAGLEVDRERNSLTRRGLDAQAALEAASAKRTPGQIIEGLANELLEGYTLDKTRPDSTDGITNKATLRTLARQVAASAIQAGDPDLAADMFDRAVRSNKAFGN